jgi:hypothetical protein
MRRRSHPFAITNLAQDSRQQILGHSRHPCRIAAGRAHVPDGFDPGPRRSGSRLARTLVPAIQSGRQRRPPAPRLAAPLRRRLPRSHPRLVGLRVVRLERAVAALRMDQDVPHRLAARRGPTISERPTANAQEDPLHSSKAEASQRQRRRLLSVVQARRPAGIAQATTSNRNQQRVARRRWSIRATSAPAKRLRRRSAADAGTHVILRRSPREPRRFRFLVGDGAESGVP